MDGITATREIRQYLEGQNIKREDQPKIIGVTGHVIDDYHQLGIAAGMDEIIPKPLYIQILTALLARYNIL